MTSSDLQRLAPWFGERERYLNGRPVDWATIHYPTMAALRQLREHLHAPIALIRGAHPNRPEAVDACCPTLPLSRVVMGLTRLQGVSWGVYSGHSFHVDHRQVPADGLPARWMAVKIEEEPILKEQGLDGLITSRAAGWAYLSWHHERSFDAMALVCLLAEGRRVPVGEV